MFNGMSNKENQPRSFYEEINVAGNQLVDRLKSLTEEGNIRRLIIKDSSDRTILEVPLTLGVVAGTGVVMFAPFLAAIGAIAALVVFFGFLAAASLSFMPEAFTALIAVTVFTWVLGVALWAVSIWKMASGEDWRIPGASALAEKMTRE
jgi:uncharacterized membrane protein